MGSECQNVPNTFDLKANEEKDVFDQFVNGDYKSLSRSTSIKPYDLELKELNKDNQVVRRLRTNSFNTNYAQINSNNATANNSVTLNDFKSSVKKLFVGSKQKLSPSSSIILNAKEKRKQKKRSFSHSMSNQYEACLTSEEEDVEMEEVYEDELSTKRPLLNRSSSKPEKKESLMNVSGSIHKNLANGSSPTNSTSSCLNSGTASNQSTFSELIEQTHKLSTDENNNQESLIVNGENKEAHSPIAELKRSESVRMRHNSNLNYPGSVSNILADQNFVQFKKSRSKKTHLAKNYIAVIILFVVNLLNYVDRYTLAGVLLRLQTYFGINDSQSGLLQTAFICSYMLLAPLFGYLGDRYSRKWLIIFGISFWSFMTFIGSYVPEDKFWLFLFIRSLVGIGEASYSCVAPTIIGDLFTDEMRTKMLALFYLAVPVGSGLGYIVGSNVADFFGAWQWSLRVTPPLGLICIILLIFVVEEPKRGGAEGSIVDTNKSSMKNDVIYLFKNKTFMWTTMGFTFASFVLGGLSWWVPIYVEYAIYSKNQTPTQISLIFGVVTCFAGLIGVALSSVLSSKLRKKMNNADPLICALGSLIAVPTLFILIATTRDANPFLFWLIAALAISGMCLSWTLVADILLYAVYPNRRSIASAMNILICHLLGDAGSPYVIGAISDALKIGKPDSFYTKFKSLQTALYAGPFFAALSFAAYLFAGIYVDEDKKKVDDYIKKSQKQDTPNSGSLNECNINDAETKHSQVYLNPVNESDANLNINSRVLDVFNSNGFDTVETNNEVPVLFNSSANLLSKASPSSLANE